MFRRMLIIALILLSGTFASLSLASMGAMEHGTAPHSCPFGPLMAFEQCKDANNAIQAIGHLTAVRNLTVAELPAVVGPVTFAAFLVSAVLVASAANVGVPLAVPATSRSPVRRILAVCALRNKNDLPDPS